MLAITLATTLPDKVIVKQYKTHFNLHFALFRTHTRQDEVLTPRTLYSLNNAKRIFLVPQSKP